MDEHATMGYRPRPAPAVPWPVWLLMVGAIVQLGVRIAPDAYSVFGPYLLVDARMVMNWIQSVTLFVLTAAVILAAERWPAGRRRLLIGAATLAVVALLRLAADIWWALWEASGHVWEANQTWLLGGFLVTAILFAIAHLLLAAGLWQARVQRPMGRRRAGLIALTGLVGLVATGVGVWAATQIIATGTGDHVAYAVAMMMLASAGFASLALLAVAAARAAPPRGGRAEVLIAAGALVTLVASAWNRGVLYVIPFQDVPAEAHVWYFTLPFVAEVLGLVMMIAGFGLAARAVRRPRTLVEEVA